MTLMLAGSGQFGGRVEWLLGGGGGGGGVGTAYVCVLWHS